MKKSFWLFVSIIILSLGIYQNNRYENHSIIVDATVTKVTNRHDDDKYKHTYYGEYTVNDKTYKNKKLSSNYTDSAKPTYTKGSTVEVRVDPKNPSKKVAEGGVFIVVGFVMTLYNFIALVRKKRTEET